ncbi:MAG: glycosyltransferase family 9 protein [Desulfovibrio sp.]|jgi:ADP-heptose:LPS heptosyltransferase|nr:glycosyltransferase family 9 protein [Desulfovibrio sp.]
MPNIRRRMHHDLPNNNICVVFRLGRLGDVVLSTGVLQRIAEERNLSFLYIVKKDFAPVLQGLPFIKETIALENRDLTPVNFLRFCRNFAARHSALSFLDLHNTPRSRLLSMLMRGPTLRCRKAGLKRRLFLASGGRLFRQGLRAASVTQRYYAAFDDTAPPAALLLPVVKLSERERQSARARLDAVFSPGARPLALHPYATHKLKALPARNIHEFASLLDRRGIPLLILGQGDSVFTGRAGDLSNASSLRELCALLSLCRALVCSDSGPMHLASAVGTPIIALFGPTTREWGFYPAGERDIVLEKDLPCRPCSLHGESACPYDCRCLTSISPEEILAAVQRVQ